jgi:hypothetical protein
MLLLNLILLIDVTFSTPTPVINYRLAWWILRQVWRKFENNALGSPKGNPVKKAFARRGYCYGGRYEEKNRAVCCTA